MLYFLCVIVVLLLKLLTFSAGEFRKVTAKMDVSQCLSLLFGKLNSFIMSGLLQHMVLPLLKVIMRETQKSKY